MRNCTDEVLMYWRDAPEKVQLHQEHGGSINENLSNQRTMSERETALLGCINDSVLIENVHARTS